jgi:hypothetical protein
MASNRSAGLINAVGMVAGFVTNRRLSTTLAHPVSYETSYFNSITALFQQCYRLTICSLLSTDGFLGLRCLAIGCSLPRIVFEY